jgi:hypothetical protein
MAACSVTGSFFTGEREERAREEDRKEGEWRGVARGLQGILLVGSKRQKQEVASAAPGSSTHLLPAGG